MADDTVTFGVGLVGGILIVLALFVVLRLYQQQSNQAQMTTYNVVRDDQGRIQSVDTLSGLPLDGNGGGQTRQQAPRVGPAQTQEQPTDPMRN